MKLHPRVTKTAVELVKRFEGLRRRAARLSDGGWTIGYGHTKSAREGLEVSENDAELLLYYDLSEVATKIEAWTFTTLNQNQFEALTAFAFNIGLENFRRSTVLKRVNEGQHLQAAAAMELWRKTEVDGEGLVSDALVRRRAAEKAHYLTPPEGFRPSPSQVLRPVFDFSVIEAAAQSQVAHRAAVVDAPLEGENATATVENPAPLATSAGDTAVGAAGVEATRRLQDVLAEAAPAPVLHAPKDQSSPPEPELLHAETIQPLNDGAETPLFAAAAPFGFKGFEPPPARFPSAPQPPLSAANETAFETPLILEPDTLDDHAPEPANHPGDFNLFDRPLAAPSPAPKASAPHIHDVEIDDYAPATQPGAFHAMMVSANPAGALQDRKVLWASIGCLGVVLFALAITTMLLGKATMAHLLIGFLGVALITPAGVYFLLRRMDAAAERARLADQ